VVLAFLPYKDDIRILKMQFLPLVRKLEQAGRGKKSMKPSMYFTSRFVFICQRNKAIVSKYRSPPPEQVSILPLQKIPLINSYSHKKFLWIIRYRDNCVNYFLHKRKSITPCAFS
jgi:hypothetical protein